MKHVDERFGLLRRSLQVTFFALLTTSQPCLAHAAINNDALEEAISNRICYEAFWWGNRTFRFGKTVPIVVRDVGDRAYVWTESLSAVPHVKTWANFFSVFASGGMVAIGQSVGFNVDALAHTTVFEKDKELVYQGDWSTVVLHVPLKCTPKYERSTPMKRLMLRVVEASVVDELMLYRENGASGLRNQLNIVIANFNPEDPGTLVLVPSKDYLFYVVFHLSSNPFSERFLRQGQYPVQPEYNKKAIKAVARKIKKYGIVQYIRMERGP